jgi:hypothetical protein
VRHIQHHGKFDWFYEFRPFLMLTVAALAIAYRPTALASFWQNLHMISCSILLVLSVMILKWRRTYRKQRASH